MITGAASAVPINYLGTLSSGQVAFGFVTLPADGNGFDNPETWQWWNFFAAAGDFITVDVDRTEAAPDMVSSAFFGLPTDTNPMIDIFDTPAGATLMAFGDDNVDDAFGGPFGDPLYSFTAPSTGWYSVAVGNFLGAGSGGYQIVITGQTPTPGAAAVLGLGGLILSRRRR
ncbi:MAG: hypothetical protein Kow0022_03360 [Phycisphaerales bacterium]